MINRDVEKIVNVLDRIAHKSNLCVCEYIRDEFIAIDRLYTVTMSNYIWTR